ncbi:aminotransferase class III-fold pyridoxal phosphate-dependent enzyme [Bacillus mycoides]|uniref:aminotransferase class III-fold pyridoxal phosphate-dependent enzyme n=1 Tax=Bacillus mycoides TaxID=1405 RepID=UPI003D64FC13
MNEKLMDRDYIAKTDFVYRTENQPIFQNSYSSTIIDSEGNHYIDGEAANGSNSLGYDVELINAATNISGNLPNIPSFLESDLRLSLANRIGFKINEQIGLKGKIAFETGGAQGIELALKMALALSNNKTTVAVFEGGYHGRSPFTSNYSSSARYRECFKNTSMPVLRLPYPDCRRCRFSKNPTTCNVECLKFIKTSLENDFSGFHNEKNPPFAALIIEPILNAGGIVIPDSRYLEGVVNYFRNMGVYIIVDEVFSGFYRTGKFLGLQNFNIKPDFIVMSKALTNGMLPLSAVWINNDVYNDKILEPGLHSSTFSNTPICFSLAHAVLDRFEKWRNIEHDINKLGEKLKIMLDSIAKFEIVDSVQVIGATARILLKKKVAAQIIDHARTALKNKPINGIIGAIFASSSLAPEVIAITPSFTITDNEIEIMKRALKNSLSAISKEEIHEKETLYS